MYCRRCGSVNDENAWKCVHCGEMLPHAGEAGVPTQPIPNYLVYAILVTIFCCWPLGIPAIVYAAQVNSKIVAGDIQGALNASSKARTFAWWSFGCGFAVGLLYLLFIIIGVAAEAGSGF